MKTVSALLLVGFAYPLAGCDVNDPPPPQNAVAKPATPLPNSNIFSTQIRALDKAKNEQKVMDQRKADLDKQLQDQGG